MLLGFQKQKICKIETASFWRFFYDIKKNYTEDSKKKIENGVKYLTEKEREAYEVFVQHDNIVDAKGNLQQFWEKVNVEKMSYEEAALNTFTGKWAKENGFSKVRIKNQKDIEPDEVTLVILKNK